MTIEARPAMVDVSMLPFVPPAAFKDIASSGSIAIQPPAPPGAAQPTVRCCVSVVPVVAPVVIAAAFEGKSGCPLPILPSAEPPEPAVAARFQLIAAPAKLVPDGERALTVTATMAQPTVAPDKTSKSVAFSVPGVALDVADLLA